MKDWIYDEFRHVGVDYSEKSNVDNYDARMESFRDHEKEVREFLDKLNVPDTEELTLIDIGCGTGSFAVHASQYFRKIYAVDVSREMLDAASSKAESGNIDNIEFCNSGFLHFQPPEMADMVHTKWAFHHLPDYWKQAGLFNMNRMLKPGGVLFLSDLVLRCDPDYQTNMDAFIDEIEKGFGREFADEARVHIRDEYSTFDWILEGMIERAGFSIEMSGTDDVLASEYLCRKIKDFGDGPR
jgi:ubiquinone/menaquinone biosynthesis C-methylase UbiE